MQGWQQCFKKILAVMVAGLMLGVFTSTSASADDDNLQKIKDQGVLRVALSPDYPPFEFQVNHGQGEEDVGLDIDIIKKIAKDLGVKLEIENMSFSSVLVAVETGKADIAIGGINPTPERKQSVDFSNIYYNGGQAFLVTKAKYKQLKSAKQLNGHTIGTQTGTLQYNLAKQRYTKSKLVGMDKGSDLVLALKTNKIEAMGVEKPVAEAYVQNDPDLVMFQSDYDLSSDETGTAIAAPKGSTSLIAAMNQSIDQIKKEHLISKYMKDAAKDMKTNTVDTSMLHYWNYFFKGFQYTLLISILAVMGGVILGVVLALMKMSHFKILSWPAISYIEIVRGTPMMVQVLLVYFGLGVVVNLPALTAGIIAVTLNSAAYISEIIRGGILSVDKGQREASQSLGLNHKDAMRFVILPQAFKNIWPALGNEFIAIIKESSIVSIIGVTDLVYELNVVRADTYRGVAPIIVVMVVYFLMTFALTRGLNYLERKMKYE
ncbi:ABC transporter substrate-binding protein/permease [Convivina praedatoris]|uniref:Membrane-bound lytic murein transglycosylase F n=1 Tax=Convivina praedatoris TaxID=2880963 RepID=A0ABM9D4F7_9LACO|nr:ABC transporter substrate-binding protein/permease [Convivina sp. LMG 32447]CAH1853789.1 Membrane-bound lytic murein transglycosylase F [Convivina sp. LMG 32447]CAH1854644.1 Membrane-bound lytic murein transglycosylase F [Convivina sp. LMG 32447]CAH1855238.1 Membrane-bound lytic murein transglycosylase F [Convivina sp. LMG 32447]